MFILEKDKGLSQTGMVLNLGKYECFLDLGLNLEKGNGFGSRLHV